MDRLIEVATQPGHHVWTIAFGIGLAYAVFHLVSAVFDVYFGPLAKIPGPKTAALTKFPQLSWMWYGRDPYELHMLHDKYGPVVRVAPNQLSFSTAQAWKDIYGHRTGGKKSFLKDTAFYRPPINGSYNLIGANDEDHARQRRILSHSFSDRALKEQEPIFQKYADLLVFKLRESKDAVDLVKMWNCATFDIMADLTFAEPLHMLDNGEYSPWVAIIFASIKRATQIRALKMLPGLNQMINTYVNMSPKVREAQLKHHQHSSERVDKRLANPPERPDLWSEVMKRKEKEGMSLGEMHSNADLFMIAGTETTATLLSGLTYHLFQNPKNMSRLVSEVRTEFRSTDDITVERLARLPYLNACLEEGLRIYPPVPTSLPRVVPDGGAMVDGHFVPAGTSVAVSQYATYRSSHNFADPDNFHPERWLSAQNATADDDIARFANDDRAAMQPFSTGPRNCIGRNLAYHEARLLLCSVLWNFDLELDPRSHGWDKQPVYTLWEKYPLWVKVAERKN